MHKTIFTLALVVMTLGLKAAEIKGTISDSTNGELLIGCTVYIEEIQQGTATGLNGMYSLKDVPPGNYTLTCNFISYEPQQVTLTITKDSRIVPLNFTLKPVTFSLGEAIVYGHKDKSTEVSARMTERNSVNVVNVVSANTIEISPDLEMSSVVQRISGITLISSGSGDAKYTVLRGMDKRYNYTLVNGIKIPSLNNRHRYVSLDIFPSDMVDRVEVVKALTPDMEGDAIAGVVNLVMKEAPAKTLIQANVGTGYNMFFTDHTFQTFDNSVINPKSLYEIHGKGYYATPNDFTYQNLEIQSQQLPIDMKAGLTLGKRFLDNKAGIIVSASYLDRYKGKEYLNFDNDVETNDLESLNQPVLSSMQERIYTERNKNMGLHGKLDYYLTPLHRIKLYTAYVNQDNTQLRESDNTNLSVSYDPENGTISRSHSTRFRNRLENLLNTTLQGEHALSNNLYIDWSLVYSKASSQTPDESSISYGTNIKDYEPYNWYIDFDGSTRLWRHNSDQDKAAYINLKYTTNLFNTHTSFKVGGLYREKKRESFYNSYTLQAIVPVVTPDTSYYSFYAEKGKDWDDYTDIKWKVYNPRGTIATGENYESYEDVMAAYGMFNIKYQRLQVIGGVRIENTDQGYYMEYPIGQPRPDGKQVYTDILPSLHVKYNLTTKQNIRLSYYKATNKPGFLEIVPCPVIDDLDNKSKGNPDVLHAIADNIDLRWEYFPQPLDQILVSLFYKKIKDPIEQAYIKEGSSQDITYSPINAEQAINMGIEIDLIKYFREIGFKGNYTFTNSDITTNKLLYTRDEAGDLVPNFSVPQERPLFGQSQHVANFSLLYKGIHNLVNGQLAFGYLGKRIYALSRFYENDNWQKGRWTLDASIQKSFHNGFSIYAKASNLLKNDFYGYIENTNAHNVQFPEHTGTDNDTMIRKESTSQTILIGIKYKLK